MTAVLKPQRRPFGIHRLVSGAAFAVALLICTATVGAQCTQSSGTVTCIGASGPIVFSASSVDTLLLSAPISNLTVVSLTGTASAPPAGADLAYTCSTGNPADCSITTNSDGSQSCTPVTNGATCVSTPPAEAGPGGNAGPSVTMSIDTGAFIVNKTNTGVAVFGSSRGSDGGAGGNAFIPGNAENGGTGADGGTVVVTFTGAMTTTQNNSSGIVARSLAGDGGNGGVAYVAGPSGNGGAGGFGGNASATFLSGSIETFGSGSVGVLAFSQGGNAGVGGAGGIIVSPGGAGAAGQAGAAAVTTGAGSTIITHGNSAYGIAARSIGGGGGQGASDSGLFYSAGTSGSTGGAGGTVTVNAFGTITTYGSRAHGILAQSLGGGGGDAGVTSGAIVTVGGTGGGGGVGGQVSVTNAGAISTHGLHAYAIEAQSIGGGGGNGGTSSGLVSTGGSGGNATAGGVVSVTNSGTLSTDYGQSAGILAQSIGGGGGVGTAANGTFYQAGGSGGTGANGAAVTVTNSGNISTGFLVPGLVTQFSQLALQPQLFEQLFPNPNGQVLEDSPGIVAQSIGGGGGLGAGSLVASAAGLTISHGGTGGAAGSGGVVEVKRDHSDPSLATAYTIHTYAQRSPAIFAQSLGGGGGYGGFSVVLSSNGLFGAGWGSAGTGGAGGSAGRVLVETKGQLITDGADSPGILAQSTGGGGGAGGYFISGTAGIAGVSVALGADGGGGGSASRVDVSNLSNITTAGFFSDGIVAESVGGGGGRGGFGIAASLGLGAVTVGVGGTGGSGGSAGVIVVNSIGDISTAGDSSAGITGRSVGGGGGSGGFSISVAGGAGSVAVGVGGKGGGGGSAQNVTINSIGLISTTGVAAPGITGESLGGGGGRGGFNVSVSAAAALAVAVGVGGKGGTGSTAGAVNITSLGQPGLTESGHAGTWTILTRGHGSAGIAGQSTGGGGGNAGFSIAVAGSATINGIGGSAAVSVGGSGGVASHGSTVDITSTGTILTLGNYSHGISAQSTGGGGGNGGFSIGAGVTLGQVGIGVSVGGAGDGGGNGSTVTVNAYSLLDASGTTFLIDSAPIGTVTLQTAGYQASGILAQSTGGGGGNGGFSIGLGGAVAGAGGGVSVGGSGKGGGTGGLVTVTSYHNIATAGDEAPGILAQSLGGGGGNGGFSIALGAGSQFGGGVSVGGAGDTGSSAGSVNVKSFGTIATLGNDAHGIQAQSIGGGGGNGGFSVGGAFTTGPVAIGVGVGGSGDGGGSAGPEVRVESFARALNGVGLLTAPALGITTLSTHGDLAHGIYAQSLGGGGGSGGFSGALGVATGQFGVGVTVGGSGAGGGHGDTVVVTSVHNIVTDGAGSSGILAQSIGGGGGNGGFSIGLGAGSTFGGNVTVGGAGDVGGNASTVTATNIGSIWTKGDDSYGIAAQSLGGGGGNGGFAVSGAFSTGGSSLAVGVGGRGDGGGAAGGVIVNAYALDATGTLVPAAGTATLVTEGDRAQGIFGQSIGGGGGNGGFSVAGAGALGDVAGGVSVGGLGKGGGPAGSVQVNSVHNILTDGLYSHGIHAQSLGGGGGNGGFSAAAGAGSFFAGGVSVGGFATGGAGDGSIVTVNHTGSIRTMGGDSDGIRAQSIGGSGGNGGASFGGSLSGRYAGGAVSVGGAGSNGGMGGAVTVNSNVGQLLGVDPTIHIQDGHGIRAQSIGGGGGNGGMSGTLSIAANARVSLSVAVGGFGGPGNAAGTVHVTSNDNILTINHASKGIYATSLGGGGGTGGMAFAGSVMIPTHHDLNISVAFGGFGGAGANGGTVFVDSTGSITTMGDDSDGVHAKSLGGGGGDGTLSVSAQLNACTTCPSNKPGISSAVGGFGGAGGAGGVVTVTSGSTIVTNGERAPGIRAQSIGGGGGNGGIAIAAAISGGDSKQGGASVGGFGGPGSNSDTVTVTNNGSITTGSITTQFAQLPEPGMVFAPVTVIAGGDSHGILAQSIGGGGGNGGLAIAGAIGFLGQDANVNIGITVGGFGGSGGFGGKVDVTNNGQVTTHGHNAHAVFAQSIGGGGGNGGGAISGLFSGGNPTSATAKNVNLTFALGGRGGDGNYGGEVVVSQSGNIWTFGNASHGIFAESIGGGGGTGGGANSISMMLGTECTREPGKIQGAIEPLFISICPKTAAEKEADKKKKRGTKVQGAIGGFGGFGNDGGTVEVNNGGSITTAGKYSAGIKAQSIGGGGGSGGHGVEGIDGLFPKMVEWGADKVMGFVDNFFDSSGSDKLVLTLGGKGGVGGNGGNVIVTNDAVITTSKYGAKGIVGQSIGGGGGDGGESDSGSGGLLSIGGFGGAAGNGGSVTIDNFSGGQIFTSGHHAHGIYAQSVGGGGGFGGSASGIIAIGGVGGDPQPFYDLVESVDFANLFPITALPVTGHGGVVTITNSGTIVTGGDYAIGIFGQSIGGGGGEQSGNGGAVSGAKVAIGGFGATAGDGGTVTIDNLASISTSGVGADAIRGQSIGGGGGSAGDNSGSRGGNATGLIATIGGGGGSAGNGSAVTIGNSMSLVTKGDQADGIFAQSIGGGGGDSGRAIGLIALGGAQGGSGGNGGTVTVTNEASGFIWTSGFEANGIMAQSIGGGGGTAGGHLGIISPTLPAEAWLWLGGDLGTGGAGGDVLVENLGTIRTDGISSQGIFAQSVGGGGGAGAMGGNVLTWRSNEPSVVGGSGVGGNGGTVTVTNKVSGIIQTNGASSTGIFAQSVGGGGGMAGIGVRLVSLGFAPFSAGGPAKIGGTGGTGGNGGEVIVLNEGAIFINGADSIGILAQSIGGGGGTAKIVEIPDLSTLDLPGPITLPTTPPFNLTLGGTAGATGSGGNVTVTNTGSITINGNDSIGIFAQSVGGGGGLLAPGAGAATAIASDGGAGGGGTVTIVNTAGAIIVNGNNSMAMVSQSVGGGGGFAGTTPIDPYVSSSAAGTDGNAAAASADPSRAFFSGSAGGFGVAAATNVRQRGHLIATGLNSAALVVQSHGPNGNGDITIDITNPSASTKSMIVGGTGVGAGVVILDGARNQLNNAGFISSVLGFDGFAIRASRGDDRIVNTGTILGSVDLGTGSNSFENSAGGSFFSGLVADLGGGMFTNHGLFSPGGEGRVSGTTLIGSFTQGSGGTFHMDLDLTALAADRVNLTGTSALSGKLLLNIIDPVGAAVQTKPGTHDFPIASGGLGATQMSLALTAPNTAVANYSLQYPNGRDVTLRTVIDFSPDGMSANATALGEAIDAIQTAQQSPAFAPLVARLFYQPNVTTLGTTYDSLAGGASAGSQQTIFLAADRLLSALGNQTAFWLGNQAGAPNGLTAANDRALESAARRNYGRRVSSSGTPSSWRLWVSGYDLRSELSGNASIGSVDTVSEGGGVLGGIDFQISPRTFIGAAAGRGSFSFDAERADARGQSTGGHVAVYGAHRHAAWYASGAFSMSFFANDVSRRVFIPGTTIPQAGGNLSAIEEFPMGNFNSRAMATSAEGGYRIPFGIFELTPYAGLQYTALTENEYTETAGGGPSLLGQLRAERRTTSLPTFTGLQLKAEGDWGQGKVLTGWIRAAWKHDLRTDRSVAGELITAPGFTFVVHGAEPIRDAIRASAGVRQAIGLGLSFFAHVDGEFARSRRALTGSAGLRAGW